MTAPLLMIAEGRRPRLRKAPVARPKEIALHMSVATHLRDHALPRWRWTHIPAGACRDAREGAKLKAMGLARGWPDLTLVSPTGVVHFLELKRIGGVLSDDQRAFQKWAEDCGIAHAVVKTLDDALAALKRWGAVNV